MDYGDREFFRVSARVGLFVERVDADRWAEEERAILSDLTESRDTLEDGLRESLTRIEEKLDLLLERLAVANPSRILRPEPQDVRLSGSGVAFQSREAIEVGARVLVEMEFGVPVVRTRCLGTVVRSEAEERGVEVAIRFDVVREMDRDRIVAFALEVERRARAGSQGAAA